MRRRSSVSLAWTKPRATPPGRSTGGQRRTCSPSCGAAAAASSSPQWDMTPCALPVRFASHRHPDHALEPYVHGRMPYTEHVGVSVSASSLEFTVMCTCRSCYGALKGTEVASSDEAARFVHHLVTLEVLKVVSERLEKKAGEKFALSRQSLALGPKGMAVLEGKLPVRFAVRVRSCSRRSTAHACTCCVHRCLTRFASLCPSARVLEVLPTQVYRSLPNWTASCDNRVRAGEARGNSLCLCGRVRRGTRRAHRGAHCASQEEPSVRQHSQRLEKVARPTLAQRPRPRIRQGGVRWRGGPQRQWRRGRRPGQPRPASAQQSCGAGAAHAGT